MLLLYKLFYYECHQWSFYSSGIGACFFLSFLLFSIMCAKYHIDTCEKISINLWILV